MSRCIRRTAILLACILLLATVASAAEQTPKTTPAFEKETILSALYEADISSIQEALRLGLITCEEITAYYLERIRIYDATYNCFVTLCEDALEIARERDRQLSAGQAQGLLFGIPVVIKDNMDYVGYATTNGYEKFLDRFPDTNADVVDYLLSEGAVIIGKTNMSTGAQDALRSFSEVAGETMNAYNRYLAAGGSSGGSAVAVSLNLAVAGLGSDTNSSLRYPAALNGCVSLRPTFGLTSVKGIKRLNSTRDTAGALTRTVYDQAIMLDAITGGVHQYTRNLNEHTLEGLRVGVLRELSYAIPGSALRSDANIDDEVAAAFDNAVEELEACGAVVVSVSVPDLFSLSDATFGNSDQPKKDALYTAFMDTLTKYDVSAVIFPTYLSPPQRSGTDENGKFWDVNTQTSINNCRTLAPCASIPEITVLIGTHTLGAGIGMEIAAPRDCEQLLLDIAYSYTRSYDYRTAPGAAPDNYSESASGSLGKIAAAYKRALESREESLSMMIEKTTPLRVPEPGAQKDMDLRYWSIGLLAIIPTAIAIMLLLRRKVRVAR